MAAPACPPFTLASVVVGRSPRMRAIFRYLAQVGPGSSPMLVTGEPGTGKELIARTLHLHSARSHGPFVAIRCADVVEGLLEAELFGHERGAIGGVKARRVGRFERAHGGTLYVGDVDQIPPALQEQLLRVLDRRAVRRVGGGPPVAVDVRVVAGASRDLVPLVREGRFREDLYYRLNVSSVSLPPLRERREDIPLLVAHLLERARARTGIPALPLSGDVVQALQAYDWPGNVGQLAQACDRMAGSAARGPVRLNGRGLVVGARGGRIDIYPDAGPAPEVVEEDHMVAWDSLAGGPLDAPIPGSPGSTDPRAVQPVRRGAPTGLGDLGGLSLDEYLRQVEADCIASALRASGGNKSRAARLLRIKRSTLGDRITRCGLARVDAPFSARGDGPMG